MIYSDIYCTFFTRPRAGELRAVITRGRIAEHIYDPVEYLHRIATDPELGSQVMWQILHKANQRFRELGSESLIVVMGPDGLHGHVAQGFGQIVARFRIEGLATG